MSLNPPSQYRTDGNLRARQRLWEYQRPPFDLVAWVLDLVDVPARSAMTILDVGCGNGLYLTRLRSHGIDAIGCDLSIGMLTAAAQSLDGDADLVNADVTALPFSSASFDLVLAPHMLYHVADRRSAAHELRRVLRPGGVCVAVTNGVDHLGSLRTLVEQAVRSTTPGWVMRYPSTEAFSLENGAEQLRTAFSEVTRLQADNAAPAQIDDASIAADWVASTADHYQPQTQRPWVEVVEEVRTSVQRVIDEHGVFAVQGVSGAFVCR
jgi:ubiquinone/menaquinone biosynthesis C-methylase UbiE